MNCQDCINIEESRSPYDLSATELAVWWNHISSCESCWLRIHNAPMPSPEECIKLSTMVNKHLDDPEVEFNHPRFI